jgi:hypothetical protein
MTLDDLKTLLNIYQNYECEVLILINYVSRIVKYQQDLTDLLLESRNLQKFYTFLEKTKDEGMKGVILQILSNSLCQKTFRFIRENIGVVLKSAELDENQPTCREWVFVIIRKSLEISPDFAQVLNEFNISPELRG